MSPARAFSDLADEFLSWRTIYGDVRQTTRYNMVILKRYFLETPITEIGQREIEAFIAARLQSGVARATINRQRAALSFLFNWAISRNYHPGPNPVKAVRKFRESPGRTRYLTPEESARLILAASDHLKPILVTLLHTGGRLGEVLALRWCDVDLERRIVYFRRETAKSGKQRMVPMSDGLLATLRLIRPGGPEDPIFMWHGRPLRFVRTAFETARRKAGLGHDVLLYTCRHTMASWFVMRGGDLFRLQKYMGHSTISLTQRYAHLSPDFLQQGVQFLGPPISKRRAEGGEPESGA